jgi:hypothetical protein
VANYSNIPKSLKKETVQEFEVEDFAELLISKHHTVATLRSKVKTFGLSKEQEKKALNRVDFAEKRVDKPLSWSYTFLFILFPFGQLLTTKFKHLFWRSLDDSNLMNVKEKRRLGFKRQVDEYYIYSIVGIFTYITVFTIASLI